MAPAAPAATARCGVGLCGVCAVLPRAVLCGAVRVLCVCCCVGSAADAAPVSQAGISRGVKTQHSPTTHTHSRTRQPPSRMAPPGISAAQSAAAPTAWRVVYMLHDRIASQRNPPINERSRPITHHTPPTTHAGQALDCATVRCSVRAQFRPCGTLHLALYIPPPMPSGTRRRSIVPS